MKEQCNTPLDAVVEQLRLFMIDLNGAVDFRFYDTVMPKVRARAEAIITAVQSETALTDEKGRPMTYWGGAASPDKPQREWTVRQGEDGRQRLCSSDFTHDVELILTGDFADANDSFEYAIALAEKLNGMPSAVEARSEGFEDWWRQQKYFDLFEDSDAKIFARNAWCAAQSAIVRRSPDEIDLICDAYIAKTAGFQCPPKFYSHLREALHEILRPTDRTTPEKP